MDYTKVAEHLNKLNNNRSVGFQVRTDGIVISSTNHMTERYISDDEALEYLRLLVNVQRANAELVTFENELYRRAIDEGAEFLQASKVVEQG